MRGISLSMATAIVWMCAFATGCAVPGEEVQDEQSALEDGARTVNASNSAYTMTVHCNLVGIFASSSDGANTGCGQGERATAAFIAGSTITVTTQADTVDCVDWKGWAAGPCAGQGRTCVLTNVNSDITIGVIEGRLFGCTPS
jgi:hypothetical protein